MLDISLWSTKEKSNGPRGNPAALQSLTKDEKLVPQKGVCTIAPWQKFRKGYDVAHSSRIACRSAYLF